MATENIVFHPDIQSLNVPPGQIARYSGGSRYRMNPEMKDRAERIIEYAKTLIRPAFVYAIHVAADLGEKIQKALLLAGGDNPPEKTAVCVCTLGNLLEEKVKALSGSGDMLESVFLDAAGVSFLESLGGKALRQIQSHAQNNGLHAGCRFGPGYADAPMNMQQHIFSLVDASVIGVSLNASFVMNPAKSLSFWVNWYRKPQYEADRYKCKSCMMENCPYRV